MHIVIIAQGTRGDVQPMIALGQALKQAGHSVRLVAGKNFATWVQSHGLEFAPTIDMEEVMQSEKGRAWVEAGHNPRRQLRYMRELLDEYGESMVDGILNAIHHADLLIDGFVSEPFAQAVHEKYGIPLISVLLQPYRPTRSGAATLMPIVSRGNSPLNLWIGKLSERFIWYVAEPTTNMMRVKKLGLPPHTARSLIQALHALPTIHAFSRHVVPHALDWPANIHTAGYWFLDEHLDWEPAPDLLRFLAAGPPPITIGFGSMSSSDPQGMFALACAALHQSGQRGIILTGWSGLERSAVPENVHVIDRVPHHWLFPRVAGVVHHGGAGTTSAALRAGVPSLIVPHMADQPYWGRRVYELGVGPRPIPRHQLTTFRLAEALQQMATNSSIKQAAHALGERIRAEQGVAEAIRVIEQIVQL